MIRLDATEEMLLVLSSVSFFIFDMLLHFTHYKNITAPLYPKRSDGVAINGAVAQQSERSLKKRRESLTIPVKILMTSSEANSSRFGEQGGCHSCRVYWRLNGKLLAADSTNKTGISSGRTGQQ